VASFPEGTLRDNSLGNVARSWGQVDPGAASEWIKALPAGKSRESVITAFTDSMQYQYPEVAVPWIETLSDDGMRNSRLENALSRWLVTDDEAARAYVQRSTLPEATKKRLLNRQP
jgi:hypothetical protein